MICESFSELAHEESFMREGRGTLKELTALWRQLDPRGEWELVEMAYGIKMLKDKYPDAKNHMPSYEETMRLRTELEKQP